MTAPARTPVFVLGCPRGGTSIFYKLLARHPDVATTTNLTRRFRGRFGLVRLAELLGARHRPVEAGELWRRIWPRTQRECTAADLTQEQRRALRALVDGHLDHFGARVFLNKRPGLALRVGWLAAALPEARFVHVVRDGRAVARSILEQCEKSGRRWSYVGRELWPELGDLDFPEYAGGLWSRMALLADRALGELPARRALTVRYEELMARPTEVLGAAARFCGLPWDDEHSRAVPALRSRNDKWREALDPAQQAAVVEHALPGLRHFGYVPADADLRAALAPGGPRASAAGR